MSKIHVEVAYASVNQQSIIELEVEEGSTIKEAITQSGICDMFPEIDLTKQKVGVFSSIRQLVDQVKAGERIEIYRPLSIDPKDARRLRARSATRSRKN